MGRGDAVYARGNVDWPLDPLCQALPDNDCRWLHEILWRMAVKERSPVLPRKYSAKWLAWAANISVDKVFAYVKVLAASELIGIDSHGQLVVFGVLNQHARLGFKLQAYPETIPYDVVAAPDWQWDHNFIPVPPRSSPYGADTSPYGADTSPYGADTSPYGADTSPNEREREKEKERHTSCPESPPGTRGPHPVPPSQGCPKQNSLQRDRGDTADKPAEEAQAVLVFPCDGPRRSYVLTAAKLREYEDTYASIDVLAACRDALQWLRDNPRRRKTADGMPTFLGNWLRRAVNRREHKRSDNGTARRSPVGVAPPAVPDPFVAKCHALQREHPHASKHEIAAMAEDALQRERAREAAARGRGTVVPVGALIAADSSRAERGP